MASTLIPAARRLRPLRRHLNVCQALGIPAYCVADEAGVAIGYLHDLARGKCQPSLEHAERIAAALGVQVEDLWPELERPYAPTA